MIAAEATNTQDKGRELQRTLYRAAKADAARRVYALYDKVYRADILLRAWQEVKTNAGAAGVDGQTSKALEHSGVEGVLATLATALREGTYRPRPVRRVRIPKADGRARVRDSCRPRARGPGRRQGGAGAGVRGGLSPQFVRVPAEAAAHQALEVVRQAVNRGQTWVVDADIQAFFDEIDADVLLRLVARRRCDRRLLTLLRQWQRAGALDGDEGVPTAQGISQGAVLSPVLANVVLHERDRLWEDDCGRLGHLVRYADARVVRCRTERDAQEALRRVGGLRGRLRLRLHPTKTQMVLVGDGDQGFALLGFQCRTVASRRYRGRRSLLRWPSRRALQQVRDRVEASTSPRHLLPEPASTLVDHLNPLVRGWGAYFRHGNASQQLRHVEEYVRERLALFLNKQAGRSRRGWGRRPLASCRARGGYELAGTVARHTATPSVAR